MCMLCCCRGLKCFGHRGPPTWFVTSQFFTRVRLKPEAGFKYASSRWDLDARGTGPARFSGSRLHHTQSSLTIRNLTIPPTPTSLAPTVTMQGNPSLFTPNPWSTLAQNTAQQDARQKKKGERGVDGDYLLWHLDVFCNRF